MMIEVRKQYPAFVEGDLTWLDAGNQSILAFSRTYEGQHILAIHNLSSHTQKAELTLPYSQPSWADLFTGKSYMDWSVGESPGPDAESHGLYLRLAPHQYLWLK